MYIKLRFVFQNEQSEVFRAQLYLKIVSSNARYSTL